MWTDAEERDRPSIYRWSISMGMQIEYALTVLKRINRQTDREIEIHVREYSQRTQNEITRRVNELIMSGAWNG
jgi:hypothetical protein